MTSSEVVNPEVITELTCYHCGQPCDEIRWLEEKPFCCNGCKTVFEILHANDLCEYYQLDNRAATSLKNAGEDSFGDLDEVSIRKKILAFDSDTFAKVSFYIPAIHCISCIWLLENLQKIERGILRSEVNLGRKTVTIDFNPAAIKLGRLAGLLGSLGYSPKITLMQLTRLNLSSIDR